MLAIASTCEPLRDNIVHCEYCFLFSVPGRFDINLGFGEPRTKHWSGRFVFYVRRRRNLFKVPEIPLIFIPLIIGAGEPRTKVAQDATKKKYQINNSTESVVTAVHNNTTTVLIYQI